MINIIGWNVRGRNGDIRVSEIHECIEDNKLGLIGLVEAKVRECNASWLARKIKKDWHFLFNYNSDTCNRIWVGWNPDLFKVSKVLESMQMIVFTATNLANNFIFTLAMIYNTNNLSERYMLWEEIKSLSIDFVSPIVLLGDFNNVLYSYKRIGGHPVQASETEPFLNCIAQAKLVEP